MTLDELEQAGYRKHVSQSYDIFKKTDTLYQKLIKDEVGKKYYIDVWVYNNLAYKREGRMPPTSPDFSFQPEVQFYGENDEVLFGVIYAGSKSSVREIEDFFEGVWFYMNCGYYQRYLED